MFRLHKAKNHNNNDDPADFIHFIHFSNNWDRSNFYAERWWGFIICSFTEWDLFL